ncbi:MAG: DUF975 family protein [Sarcina sp.]
MERQNQDFNKEWRSSDFREDALIKLRGKWKVSLIVTLSFLIIIYGVNAILDMFLGKIFGQINFIIVAPITAGITYYFVKLSSEKRVHYQDLYYMFGDIKTIWKSIAITFLVSVGSFFFTLLLIVPGIIFAYTFSMAIAIFTDNNDIGIIEAMKESARIMKGEKWNLFKLQITFIGWWILVFAVAIAVGVTFFFVSELLVAPATLIAMVIGLTWLLPFYFTANFSFYNYIKDKGREK